jgi:penicillin-binding protein 1A
MKQPFINRKPGILAAALALMGAMVFGAAAGAVVALTRDLPQIRALESFRPSAVTRVYSADGKPIAEFFVEKRDPVPLERIPVHLKNALLATEDRSFYRHSGIDLRGILRAIAKDLLAGKFVEGASTITQQLAKTLFLTPEKTLIRKLKEAVLAFQLERRYTKSEILELYLNQVYFGSGAYGVSSAARTFFETPVERLDLAQCALIAGMPKAPSRYSPLVNPALAVRRRNRVLGQMRRIGKISETEYRQATDAPLATGAGSAVRSQAPYFVAYIKEALETAIGSALLYRGGLTVTTTLDTSLQQAAQASVRAGLDTLQGRVGRAADPATAPQGALVAVDISSGGIRAMVGGRDFTESPFNRAIAARRQPGSAFKPFVFALAIERAFAQNHLVLDAPITFKNSSGKDWRPENFSRSYLGEITLRKALALSRNIPAIRLMEKLGPDAVARFSRNFGLPVPPVPTLALALGTADVTLMELTAAYAAFANQGRYTRPHGVLTAVDAAGKTIFRARPRKRVAMSRSGAAIMTDMLRAVVQEGTGRQARRLGRPVAGKTGTTDDFHDALFVGFSPGLAAGVWVGRDRPAPLGPGETGARAALPIWTAFMAHALSTAPLRYFDMPDDVVRRQIDPGNGKPTSRAADGTVGALFRKKAVP